MQSVVQARGVAENHRRLGQFVQGIGDAAVAGAEALRLCTYIWRAWSDSITYMGLPE